MQPVNLFAEIGGSELNAAICVEHDTLGDASEMYGIAKGVDREETVGFIAHPASDYLVGK